MKWSVFFRLHACMLGFRPHSGDHRAHSTRSLFVCLFVGRIPEKPYFASCLEGSKPPGNDSTRNQHFYVRETKTCMLVCWDFIDTLEIITRILREVVNRERLWDTNAFVCLFVCLFVVIKPEHLYFAPCVRREVITPGNDRTRTQALLRA